MIIPNYAAQGVQMGVQQGNELMNRMVQATEDRQALAANLQNAAENRYAEALKDPNINQEVVVGFGADNKPIYKPKSMFHANQYENTANALNNGWRNPNGVIGRTGFGENRWMVNNEVYRPNAPIGILGQQINKP